MKIKKVCTNCGSENMLQDAYVSWNKETQKPEVHSTFDTWHCQDCEGEASAKDVELTPSKEEILEEMELHNNDEVGIDNQWTYEDAEYHLLLSDKYHKQTNITSITNIDDIEIWNSNKAISFLDFMNKIMAENSEPEDYCLLKTDTEAISYLDEYCNDLTYKTTQI